MSRLRNRVAQRLKEAQNNYALLTTFQEVDMLNASECRKELGEDFHKKFGVKLGFMSFFVRAATLALQEFPIVNSVIDGNEIVRRNYIDMSVAVSTPTGLLVPVLRNCQNLKFQDIELVILFLFRELLN
jgi:2-oxoglutarate dehydrogenase E2 component (dihydrolipoamide succinyltransferase)